VHSSFAAVGIYLCLPPVLVFSSAAYPAGGSLVRAGCCAARVGGQLPVIFLETKSGFHQHDSLRVDFLFHYYLIGRHDRLFHIVRYSGVSLPVRKPSEKERRIVRRIVLYMTDSDMCLSRIDVSE
jgi:hypothetical protein